MDLDLRKLRYFVAVGDTLHFGRAAERLFIAQPVLSRQVQALEQEFGCALLVRTTRSVTLTAAGEALHAEAREVFAAVDAALRRVHEADRGVARLVVGFAPGLRVSEAAQAFSAVHGDVEVEFLPLRWWEQDAPLRDGRADVGFLRRPFDDVGLLARAVGTETKVVCLPVTHALARRRSVTMADLSGDVILDAQSRRTSSVKEKFELIAAGHGIAMVPQSVARAYARPDLVYRSVPDAAPVDTCLVVTAGQREPRVLDFVSIAAEVLADPAPSAGRTRLAAVR